VSERVAENGLEQLVKSEQERLITCALAELPQEQQEIVLLRIRGDLSFREIANLQNVSINTVQSRYRYGMEKLRSILNGEASK
jgi:RNA polymerase sigma-70 factor (ECF subfamily)